MVNIGGKSAAEITFRRALVTDAHQPEGLTVQGIYYQGGRAGRLRIEDSILMRNGFRADPTTVAWPPSGDQIWGVYNRNLYLQGETDGTRTGLFDSISMLGASGDQFRAGGRLERNFFYQGYVTMGASGGYPDNHGPTGSVLDNVLQRFVASGTRDNRGHPGWGLGLTSGAHGVEVARNIVTGAQHNPPSAALEFSPLGWYCYDHVYRHATRRNWVHDNIFESGGAAPIRIEGGLAGESPIGCAGYPGTGGVRENTIAHNVFIATVDREADYTLKGAPSTAAAVGTDAAYFDANAGYTSRAAAAAERQWPDPHRSLKTYLQSQGVAVQSADGFPEFFARAVQQRRGQWRPQWTSRALNDHVRAGFNLPPADPR